MPMTPDEAFAKMKALGMPKVFEMIWEGTAPPPLSWMCARPFTFFEFYQELVETFPRIAHCVLLWEENGDTIFAIDPRNQEYFCYFYENHFSLMGKTYQQFVSAYFVELVFAGFEDELDHLSDLFSYHHLPKLKEWAAVEDDEDLDADEIRRRFVESIDD